MRRIIITALSGAMIFVSTSQFASAQGRQYQDDRGAEIMLGIIQGIVEERERRREEKRWRRYREERRQHHYDYRRPPSECFYDRFGRLRFCN